MQDFVIGVGEVLGQPRWNSCGDGPVSLDLGLELWRESGCGAVGVGGGGIDWEDE